MLLTTNDANHQWLCDSLEGLPISTDAVDTHIYLTTIRKFKGLERAVVLVIGIEERAIRRSELLYVAFSRARLRLFVWYHSECDPRTLYGFPGQRMVDQSLLDDLNTVQQQATQSPLGVTIIRAGAGSGKTYVLIRRIAFLIDSYQVAPEAIVAVTFTRKAATEVRERLRTLLGNDVADRVTVGTFHMVANTMLRHLIIMLPSGHWRERNERFSIMDSSDQSALFKRFQHGDVLYTDASIKWIKEQKTNGVLPHSVPSSRDREIMAFLDAYRQYEQHLMRHNQMDFDDLIVHFVNLLTDHPDLHAYLNARWQHLCVDEFQDTNQVQFQMIQLLAGTAAPPRSLLMIGDAQQAIYGWRGAKYQLFRDAQSYYPDATSYDLVVNYRSDPPILDVAHTMVGEHITGVPPLFLEPFSRNRAVTLEVISVDTVEQEATHLVQLLRTLHRQGIVYRDMTILMRSPRSPAGLATTRVLMPILKKAGIPCFGVGIRDILKHPYSRLMATTLKVLDEPTNDAVLGAWLELQEHIGQKTVAALLAARVVAGIDSLWSFLNQDSIFGDDQRLTLLLQQIPGLGGTRIGTVVGALLKILALLPTRVDLTSRSASAVRAALLALPQRL